MPSTFNYLSVFSWTKCEWRGWMRCSTSSSTCLSTTGPSWPSQRPPASSWPLFPRPGRPNSNKHGVGMNRCYILTIFWSVGPFINDVTQLWLIFDPHPMSRYYVLGLKSSTQKKFRTLQAFFAWRHLLLLPLRMDTSWTFDWLWPKISRILSGNDVTSSVP